MRRRQKLLRKTKKTKKIIIFKGSPKIYALKKKTEDHDFIGKKVGCTKHFFKIASVYEAKMPLKSGWIKNNH